MKTTDNLIDQLSTQPHLSWQAFRRRQIMAAVTAFVLVASGQYALVGIRSDFDIQLTHPDYLAKFGLLLFSVFASFSLLLRAGQPGNPTIPLRYLLVAILTVFIPCALIALAQGDVSRIGPDALQCIFWINLFGLVPMFFMGFMLHRAAPQDPVKASLTLALTTWSLTSLAYTLHCDSDLAFAQPGANLTMLGMYMLALPLTAGISYLARGLYTRW